jgi:hypothetical protein
MAPVKTRPADPPFNLGPIESRGMPTNPWFIAAVLGFLLGVGGFLFWANEKDEVDREERRRFMGECIHIKGQSEKRCSELWRWRLDK